MNAHDFYEDIFKENLKTLGPGWTGKQKIEVFVKDGKFIMEYGGVYLSTDIEDPYTYTPAPAPILYQESLRITKGPMIVKPLSKSWNPVILNSVAIIFMAIAQIITSINIYYYIVRK